MTAETWLRQLCDATDKPPQTDDIDVLLAAWAGVVAARQAVLDGEHPDLRGANVGDVLGDLGLREDAWRAAFAVARQRVGMQRVGVAQVRRYQRLDGAADI